MTRTPISPHALAIAGLLGAAALAACSTPGASAPVEGSAPAPADSARAMATATATVNAAATATTTPTGTPTATAAASAEPAPSASAAASAAPEAPLPAVKVTNIGMHIGGGPNDAPTKEPIKRSVEPHFDEFKRCFAQVAEVKKGDFGVDLRIDRAGGKAKVSHPRTALKGKEFEECVVHVFEQIDFLKPKGGTTTVSYSLRFTP